MWQQQNELRSGVFFGGGFPPVGESTCPTWVEIINKPTNGVQSKKEKPGVVMNSG